MSQNRVIGNNNAMPWSLKEDLTHFKKLTNGWPCIMGRKTWESLPKKPLPGRLNIIVSNTMTEADSVPDDALCPRGADIKIFNSLISAIGFCSSYQKIFICGGETIYKQAMAAANKIELTLIHKNYEGDTFFPEIDPSCWMRVSAQDFEAFSFITYSKINSKNTNLT
ncbi:MAG: dihydrofolate reductase [Treponema sp.]|nr:dihydrofolate reductase [Treponema sp.]